MTDKEAICPACNGDQKHIRQCVRCKGRGVILVHHHIWEDLARLSTQPDELPEERHSLFARAIEEAHAWLETALIDSDQRWRTPSAFLKVFELGGWAPTGSNHGSKNRAALLFLRSMKKYRPSDPDGIMTNIW